MTKIKWNHLTPSHAPHLVAIPLTAADEVLKLLAAGKSTH